MAARSTAIALAPDGKRRSPPPATTASGTNGMEIAFLTWRTGPRATIFTAFFFQGRRPVRHDEPLPYLLGECCSPEAKSAHLWAVSRNSKGLCRGSMQRRLCCGSLYSTPQIIVLTWEESSSSSLTLLSHWYLYTKYTHSPRHFKSFPGSVSSAPAGSPILESGQEALSVRCGTPCPAQPWSCTPSQPSCRGQAQPGSCRTLPWITFLGAARWRQQGGSVWERHFTSAAGPSTSAPAAPAEQQLRARRSGQL